MIQTLREKLDETISEFLHQVITCLHHVGRVVRRCGRSCEASHHVPGAQTIRIAFLHLEHLFCSQLSGALKCALDSCLEFIGSPECNSLTGLTQQLTRVWKLGDWDLFALRQWCRQNSNDHSEYCDVHQYFRKHTVMLHSRMLFNDESGFASILVLLLSQQERVK